ncbi:MAG: hypothetical protein KAI66_08565 [Lentisphaeria bacterium]|nr:hypothetical protein [Lentisphaeria bacterium]
MMDRGVLIGVDLGTTNLKAAAFDMVDGATLGGASRRLPVRIEADGTREQDCNALGQALADVFADLRTTLGARWKAVAALGLAAQGGSGAIVDGATGVPRTPMYLWNDSRASVCQADVASAKSEEYWERLSQRKGPGTGLARMRWIRGECPELFDGGNMYVGAGELAYFLMTGEWRQDACNALQMGCYNVLEDRLDAEPLEVAGVDLSFVAPLREGDRIHPLGPAGAKLLGLPQGLPVAGPYMDHEAGYLSARGVCARPLQVSLGTAWVGNFVVDSPAAGHSPVQLVIGSPTGAGSLVIQPLLTGNVSQDWGLENLLGGDLKGAFARADEILGETLLPPEGLVCLPWLNVPNPLASGTLGGGAFLGMNAHTSTDDLFRALVLGMCCEFHRVFENVASHSLVDGVILGGGSSKAGFFRTLLAALFAPLSVYPLEDEDLAGARGTLTTFSALVATATPKEPETPDQATIDSVRAHYTRYVDLFSRLYGHSPAAGSYVLAPQI